MNANKKLQQMNKVAAGESPLAIYTTKYRNEERQFSYLKTVHSMQELDDFRFEHYCKCSNMRLKTNFKTFQMRCMNEYRSKCPFSLLALRLAVAEPDQKQQIIHVYAHGSHNHRVIPEGERLVRILKQPMWSDEQETTDSFSTPNGRQWQMQQQKQNDIKSPAVLTRLVNGVRYSYNYQKTVNSLQELDDFRFEHECDFPNKRDFANLRVRQMRCIKAVNPVKNNSSCPFALLAWRSGPDQKQIRVYTHGSHNHQIAPIDKRAMHQKICWSDEQKPPAHFSTPDGCEWTFLETKTTNKSEKKFANLLLELKRKFYCQPCMQRLEKRRSVVRCLTLFCTNRNAGINFLCNFKMLAQGTDQGRIHLYTSGQHRCMYKDDNVLSQYVVLPDAHPPTSIVTKGGQNWTFLETLEPGKDDKDLVAFARTVGQKYNCYKPAIGQLIKQHSIRRRMQFYCTTVVHGECRFRMLAHKTDGGRFHLYKSGKHTCLHGDNGIDRRTSRKYWNRKKKEKQNKTNESEEETVEDEEEVEVEIDDMEEQDELEEDEEVIEEMEEENEEDEYEDKEEECMKLKEEMEEEGNEDEANSNGVEEENDDEENAELDDKQENIAKDLRIRSPTVPHEFTETNDVQFVDFVDHPKYDGLKMRRQDEPKKETGAVMITLEDKKEPAKVNRKMKMPKREMVKEEAPEDQPSTSNRKGEKGQRSQTTIENRTTVVPIAVINSQQPAVMARVRWWAESVANDGTAARNNEQRLFRERKRRINYRE